MIGDVLGIIVLAIGMAVGAQNAGSSGGIDWAAIWMIAVKAFVIWLGATIAGVIAARKDQQPA